MIALVIALHGWMIMLVISIVSLIAVILHDDGGGFTSGLGNMIFFFIYWLPFNGLMWVIYFIIN
jgi:hypothetical protein